MAEVVGVVFSGGPKVYHFDPAGLALAEGDRVVVQTATGPEIGEVVEAPHEVDDSDIAAALKKVQRIATDKDLETQAASESLRREAMATCREMIRSHGLDMKLVGAEIGLGGEKITFSFFSEERVDFRTLVADLSQALETRIELRQVGAREEARMVGGLGPCGRALCCTVFPGDDDPVSIRMAKEQNLPLNPTKISGLCGRLMCCLKYEQDQYVCFRKESPAKGTRVCTPEGDGVVSGYMLTKESVAVKMEDGSHGEVRLCQCECQADGSLLFTPEEKPPAPSPWDLPPGLGRSMVGEGPDFSQPASDAGAGAGEGGESTQGKSEGSRPGRSRRSRSRRRGRGRGPDQGQPAGEGAAVASGGQQTGSRPPGERTGGGQAPSQGTSGQGGASKRPRRRRRPRKPGSGGAPGAPGNGGGNGGGGSGS